MDKPVERPRKSMMDTDVVRGVSTNRSISTTFENGFRQTGVFESLGLTVNELKGKKVLEVGTGGGRVIDELRQRGIDVVGVDIVPSITEKKKEGLYCQLANEVDATQHKLRLIATKYPGSIVAADGAEALPFPDDTFDVVFSHIALPDYARSPSELAISLLEMIRVSKDRLIIDGDDFQNEYYEGFSAFGTGSTQFEMEYEVFLQYLVDNYGISYLSIQGSLDGSSPAFHFDLKNKNAVKLVEDREKIIDKAESLKRVEDVQGEGFEPPKA